MNRTTPGPLSIFIIALIFFISPNIAYSEEPWSGDMTLGYTQTNGNTEKSSFNISGSAKKVFNSSELSIKGDVYTASTDDQLDDQKWSSLVRYDIKFGEDDRWFNSYQVLGDHDRFADVDYRITPSVGIGYWLYKEEDFSWMVEGSLGYEMTTYRSSKPDDESAVALGHTKIEKKIFDNAKIAEDFTIIPALESGEGFRIKSETELTNPISESMDLSVKYVLDYDSEPSDGKKKTDSRIVTGVKYSF